MLLCIKGQWIKFIRLKYKMSKNASHIIDLESQIKVLKAEKEILTNCIKDILYQTDDPESNGMNLPEALDYARELTNNI